MENQLPNNQERTPADAPRQPAAIRTYEGDVASALKNQKTSVVSMVLAEKRRRAETAVDEQEKQPKSKKTMVVIIAVVGLLLILAVGIYLYIALQTHSSSAQQGIVLPEIILTDEEKEIDVTDLTSEKLVVTLKKERSTASLSLGSIQHIFFTETTQDSVTGQKIKKLVETEKFVQLLDTRAPAAFLRSLNAGYIYGLHATNGTQPFVIFKTNSYETAFAGMLAWEENMREDLAIIVTLAPALPAFNAPKFEDVVVKNRDVRVLKDASGKPELMYSFPDRSTLIITTNENTLKEIFDRLSTTRFTQ